MADLASAVVERNTRGRFGNKTAGAVVLGGDYQGLGIVRSLGKQGVPTCVVDDERSIARYSRYAGRAVHFPNLKDERNTVDALLSLGRRLDLEGWLLYPTRDELVAALSRHREELSQVFRVPTPEWESVRWAWDKRNTYELATQLGIPIPATRYPNSLADLQWFDELTPPFAIKPAIKEHFVYATRVKAWCAHSHAELRTLFEKAFDIVGPGEVMVQDVIPGGGSQQYSYCAFFRDGEAVGSMVARRRRQHPLQFGRASTFVETIDQPELVEVSERFLKAIDYYGLVELEYKLDPRDGMFRLLDVNARTWGYHSLGASAGVDFSYMLFADQMGLPVTPAKAKPGVAWMRTTTDIPTVILECLAGSLSPGGYLRSLGMCRTEAVFSMSDPLPGIAELVLIPYLAAKRGF
ncbi:MAG: ATP-grasp domain-containing protein [Terriglobales bacterium]